MTERLPIKGPSGNLAAELLLPQAFDREKDHCTLVILMHGFRGSKTKPPMLFLSRVLPEVGYGVLRFDFDGYGESDGAPEENTVPKMIHKVTLGLMPDVTGASTIPGVRADIVVAGKPAHAAGMRSGDVIQELDGKPVKDINEYMERLSELKAGTTIPVKVLRGGEIIELQVHLNPAVQ